MNARQHLQVAMAAVMTTFTVALSVHGLAEIAAKGQASTVDIGNQSFPLGALAFIGGLDGMAFVAALSPKHELPDLIVLVAAHLASAALQFVAAPADPWAKAVHTTPVLMTGVAIWLLIRSLGHRTPTKPASRPAPPRPRKTPNQTLTDPSRSNPAEPAQTTGRSLSPEDKALRRKVAIEWIRAKHAETGQWPGQTKVVKALEAEGWSCGTATTAEFIRTAKAAQPVTEP